MRRTLVALTAAVALIAGVTTWLGLRPAPPAAGRAAPAAVVDATAPSTTEADAAAAAAALSALATDPDSLVADAARPLVGAEARQAVPVGSIVTPDERTWAPDGVGGGTLAVRVTPPGGPAVDYAAVMVREAGGWKVLATLPLNPA